MATSKWYSHCDKLAYLMGQEAASSGRKRICTVDRASYNEKAAFNDGWDSMQPQQTLIDAQKVKSLRRKALASTAAKLAEAPGLAGTE